MSSGERDDQVAMNRGVRAGRHDEFAVWLGCKRSHSAFDVARITHGDWVLILHQATTGGTELRRTGPSLLGSMGREGQPPVSNVAQSP